MNLMKKKKHKKPKIKHSIVRKFLKLLKNPIFSQRQNEIIRKNCRSISQDIFTFLLKQLIKNKTTKLQSYVGLFLIKEILYEKGYLKTKSLKGEHVFITGAGSGIGKAMAIKLAVQGSKVSLIGRTLEKLKQVEAEIISQGQQAQSIQCDVTDADKVHEACKSARVYHLFIIQFYKKNFGEIDILINNAGIVSGKTLLESSKQDIHNTIETNLVALQYTTREILPAMIARNHGLIFSNQLLLSLGHIVTVASTAGIIGIAGLTDYCASKAGAIAFDESLRMELKKLGSKANKIKTTCLNPYFIDTGMFDGVENNLPIYLPMLKEDFTVTRMVYAILQEEQFVIIPNYMKIIPFLKLILTIMPVNLFDSLVNFIGINKAMESLHLKAIKPKL